jgi:hypothetical protein
VLGVYVHGVYRHWALLTGCLLTLAEAFCGRRYEVCARGRPWCGAPPLTDHQLGCWLSPPAWLVYAVF